MNKLKKQKGNNDETIKKISFYITLISTLLSITGCILIALENAIGIIFVILGVFGFILVFEINGEASKYSDIIIKYREEYGK